MAVTPEPYLAGIISALPHLACILSYGLTDDNILGIIFAFTAEECALPPCKALVVVRLAAQFGNLAPDILTAVIGATEISREPMDTLFANSPDGTPVAYDRSGTGPAIVLLHGGGSMRQEWHEAGYVKRLRESFTVITVDLRGHGESGLPTDPASYITDRMGQDILAVADACGIERFIIWGMSYGGKVSRYLAVQSQRVAKLILMGTPLGPGVSGELRQDAIDFCAHWPPIVQAQRDGTLDLDSLPQGDRDFLRHFNVPVMLGWVRAMLDWAVIEPPDFRCPTLWLVGSEDRHAMASIKEREESLKGSRVQVHIVEALDHEQVFAEIDRVFPTMLAFTQS